MFHKTEVCIETLIVLTLMVDEVVDCRVSGVILTCGGCDLANCTFFKVLIFKANARYTIILLV